jgi:hypothetical protein
MNGARSFVEERAHMRLIGRTLAAAILISFGASAQSKKAPEPAPLALPSPQPELALPLPMPAQPPLDLGLFLKDTSLCVFPFLKESARGSADKAYLDSIQKTFFDVAKDSPLLKDAVMLSATLCDVHDAACFSAAGKQARCQNVLVGSSAAKGNGFVLSVRMFEVGKVRIMPGSEVEQVLETDRQSDVQAWAEGQACRALQVKCVGRINVDADRKDMNIYVDNRLAPRSFKTPEQIAVEPGVHAVRISIGQRTSLEKKVAVRRNQFSDLVYARQTEKGGLPLTLASELRGAPKPGPSTEFSEGGWQKPVGYTVAAAGLVAIGIAAYEGTHAKSLMNDANAKYTAQQAYLQGDVATIDSSKSAAKTANLLYVVGAVLLAAGLTTVFVF